MLFIFVLNNNCVRCHHFAVNSLKMNRLHGVYSLRYVYLQGNAPEANAHLSLSNRV